NLDLNGDGIPDVTGLFGPCTMLGFPSTECSTRFPTAVGPTQCGFISFGLSAPRSLPSGQENLYVLQCLPPGEYIVQALQTIAGGFSSPVRSFCNPSIPIRSDDDVFLSFFPNPQIGEFYNGPSTGCNPNNLTTCLDANGNRSRETSDSSDN